MDLQFKGEHLSHKALTSSLTSDALERTYRKVVAGWFPADDCILEHISKNVRQGTYNSNPNALIEDVKKDVSIYLFLVRKLALEAKNQNPAVKTTPSTLLINATQEQLETYLCVPRTVISPYAFTEINESSAWRMCQSLRCAVTTELLADSLRIDPLNGFSCGLMRQLGLTLIAWNFPHIFDRAKKKISKEYDLDARLKQALGFFPLALGAQYARECNFSEEVLSSFSGHNLGTDVDPFNEVEDAPRRGLDLFRICEIAQTFVEISDPDHYPEAHSHLSAIQESFDRIVGPGCSQTIKDKTATYWDHYEDVLPENVKDDVTRQNKLPEILTDDFDPEYVGRLMKNNPFLESCSINLRDALIELYYKMREDRVSQENLETLFKKIILENGIRGACVFMPDATQSKLLPVMKVGNVSYLDLKPVPVVKHSLVADPISAAFETRLPHKFQSADGESEYISISGSIGAFEKVGVLYLEMPAELEKKTSTLVAFKAIRCCLIACLGLPA